MFFNIFYCRVYGAEFGSTVSNDAFMLLVKNSSTMYVWTHRIPSGRSRRICVMNEVKRRPRNEIRSKMKGRKFTRTVVILQDSHQVQKIRVI